MKNSGTFVIRNLQLSEYPFLKEMFYAALHVPAGAEPFPKSIIEAPELAKYIANWGRLDDIALVAVQDEELVGAVWCRVLKATEKGYGYVDDKTPELSLAIQPNFRNQGLGTQLMEKAFDALRAKGFKQVSLSVDQDNQAVNLYQRLGFDLVEEIGTAFTMKKVL